MRTLGQLLTEAAKKGGAKKGGGSSGITIKIAGGGGAAGAKNDKKKPAAKPSKEKQVGKAMRDLLAHHDVASVYHRQKAQEHREWGGFHGKSRMMTHLGVLHKKAQEHHEALRGIYHKLSNATYKALDGGLEQLKQRGVGEKKKKAKKK